MFKKYTVCLLLLISCASTDKLSTYHDFGEKKGIEKIVDDLFVYLLKDERTKESFQRLNLDKTKEGLSNFICVTLEGPCKYEGQSMKRAHKGQEITERQFYGMVENMQKAMNKNNIPQRAQNNLLGKLAAMHKDIIGN